MPPSWVGCFLCSDIILLRLRSIVNKKIKFLKKRKAARLFARAVASFPVFMRVLSETRVLFPGSLAVRLRSLCPIFRGLRSGQACFLGAFCSTFCSTKKCPHGLFHGGGDKIWPSYPKRVKKRCVLPLFQSGNSANNKAGKVRHKLFADLRISRCISSG